MLITLNGRRRRVPDRVTLDVLLSSMLAESGADRARGIAVAVHGEVVPRSQWSSTTLPPGAVIEVLTAVQGG